MYSLRKLLLFVFLLVLLIASPTFAQDDSMTAGDSSVEFDITLNDYTFTVAGMDANQPLQLQVGQTYRLRLTNASTTMMAHEILFGRIPILVTDTVHLDYEEPMLTDVEVLLFGGTEGEDFIFVAAGMNELELGTGQTVTLEITLPESKIGEWEIGCFEFLSMDSTEDNPGPTHYDVGMLLPIIVSAAS